MHRKFDLHTHSTCSDGADAPATVVQKAKANGLTLLALTDHDTLDGVAEAARSGRENGVTVLPALEMDTEWPTEMHILGLDVDVQSEVLLAALALAKRRREERNAVILDKLASAGCDIARHMTRAAGNTTRLHIALALVEAGCAKNLEDAFSRYLRRGCPGYYTVERFSPQEVVSIILRAKGVPVWAHPFHGSGRVHEQLTMLMDAGIAGLEAYHTSATAGQSSILLSLAQQNGLLVTCGSDSHGAHRPSATIGGTWRDTKALGATFDFFMKRQVSE